ncbi:MAG: SDR family oxidoreductase [Pseudomonadales bacterium]
MLGERVYVVTGGSQGFGFAIASELINAGGRVGLLARSEDKLAAAVAKLGEEKAFPVVADVSDKSQIDEAFEKVHAHFGRIDGLVNNAGVARPGPISEISEDDLRLQFDVNVIGLVLCCQAARPFLKNSDNPRIVNIGSASSIYREECRHVGIYAASKAAVDRLSAELRDELRSEGIGVSVVIPGAAATDFTSGWDEEKIRLCAAEWADYGKYMDTGMEPADVGEAVVHCVSRRPGVAIDTLTVRPNVPTEKVTW